MGKISRRTLTTSSCQTHLRFKGLPSNSSSALTQRCWPFPSRRSLTGRMELCLNSNNNNNSNHNNSNNLLLVNSSSSSSLSSSNSLLGVSSSHNNPLDNLHALIKQLLRGRKRLCRT